MSASNEIRELAGEYGWRVIQKPDNTTRFKRLGWIIDVTYNRAGAITEAVRDREGTGLTDHIDRNSKDKVVTVSKWLTRQ